MIVNIPKALTTYRIVSDWSPMVGWAKRNLVLLRKQGFTGMKQISVGKFSVYDETTGMLKKDDNGAVVREERFTNKTIVNPLFVDDEGKAVPVMVHFPEDTTFVITEFRSSYATGIGSVWFKILTSPDKTLKGCCVELSVSQFNGIELEEMDE